MESCPPSLIGLPLYPQNNTHCHTGCLAEFESGLFVELEGFHDGHKKEGLLFCLFARVSGSRVKGLALLHGDGCSGREKEACCILGFEKVRAYL